MQHERISLGGLTPASGEIFTSGKNGSYPCLSGDGTVVVFTTTSSDMPGIQDPATYGETINQTYVRDLVTGVTTMVSGELPMDANDPMMGREVEGDGHSDEPAISRNGRFVVFETGAQNLPVDTTGVTDVYVYDRANNKLKKMSARNDGTEGNGLSRQPKISQNGRWAVFSSRSTNLQPAAASAFATCGVLPDDGFDNVYLLDRGEENLGVWDAPTQGARTMYWISVGWQPVFQFPSGQQIGTACARANGDSTEASISQNGCRVAFLSQATNLDPNEDPAGLDGTTQVYAWFGDTQELRLVSRQDGVPGTPATGTCGNPVISGDGRYVAFWSTDPLEAADQNGLTDVYVRGLDDDKTVRVSLTASGTEFSKEGIMELDLWTGFGRPVSISDTGRFVAFSSPLEVDDTSALVPTGAEVLIRDLDPDGNGDFTDGATTVYVSLQPDATFNDGRSGMPLSFSDGARWIAFPSQATTLLPNNCPTSGDCNGSGLQGQDIYRRELWQ